MLENKYHLATFSALGANPTPMSFSEVYTALSTKQIDGQDVYKRQVLRPAVCK